MLKKIFYARVQKVLYLHAPSIASLEVYGPTDRGKRNKMAKVPYALAMGSIIYAMLCTRPDVAHVLSIGAVFKPIPVSVTGISQMRSLST